jgi:hypothetical protein
MSRYKILNVLARNPGYEERQKGTRTVTGRQGSGSESEPQGTSERYPRKARTPKENVAGSEEGPSVSGSSIEPNKCIVGPFSSAARAQSSRSRRSKPIDNADDIALIN